MQNLVDFFRKTLDDKKISGSEKKALQQILAEHNLNMREQNVLRSKIFKMARETMLDHTDHQILDWLEDANKLLIPDREKIDSTVLFSPQDDCAEVIIDYLRKAVSEICICVFTISDNRISNEIIASYKDGKKIRIITDDEKTRDLGSDISRLSREGLDIRIDHSSYHMHHKFCVIDRKITITGSYNWTKSADDYNYENILITDNPEVAHSYQNEFNTLWAEMKKY